VSVAELLKGDSGLDRQVGEQQKRAGKTWTRKSGAQLHGNDLRNTCRILIRRLGDTTDGYEAAWSGDHSRRRKVGRKGMKRLGTRSEDFLIRSSLWRADCTVCGTGSIRIYEETMKVVKRLCGRSEDGPLRKFS
jgi:hypothetical protein